MAGAIHNNGIIYSVLAGTPQQGYRSVRDALTDMYSPILHEPRYNLKPDISEYKDKQNRPVWKSELYSLEDKLLGNISVTALPATLDAAMSETNPSRLKQNYWIFFNLFDKKLAEQERNSLLMELKR